MMTQQELDTMYGEYCNIVKKYMGDKLSDKVNKVLSDKRRKVKKDYQNDELDDLDKAFCTAVRE